MSKRMSKRLTKRQIRVLIRTDAESRDCKYRITKTGDVHYYGPMPNTNITGWYEMGDAATLAAEIARECTSDGW